MSKNRGSLYRNDYQISVDLLKACMGGSHLAQISRKASLDHYDTKSKVKRFVSDGLLDKRSSDSKLIGYNFILTEKGVEFVEDYGILMGEIDVLLKPKFMFNYKEGIVGNIEACSDRYIEEDSVLTGRIRNSFSGFGAKDGLNENLAKNLMFRHSENRIGSHGTGRLKNSLENFDLVRDLFDRPKEAEFAVLFTNSMFDSRRPDSEEVSSEYAQHIALTLNLNQSFSNNVRELIMETKHKKIPEYNDSKLFCDIDISVFGKSPVDFERYEIGLKKDYIWGDDEKFRKGKINLFEKFLERPSIYSSKYFRDLYEDQARKNLTESLEAIKSAD